MVNEAVENMNGNGLYYKFQTDNAFRYKAVNILAQNGYLVHGTDAEFDSFDSSKIRGGTRGNYGYGAYFTNAAYKCEEYGRNFIFLYARDFNFLKLAQKVADNDIYKDINKQVDYIRQNIAYFEEMLYSVRTVKEYEYAEKELKTYKEQLDDILPDSKTEAFIEQYNLILRKNPDIDYRNMTKKLDNIFTNAMGADFVTNMFLKAGYDGYTIDFEYVIFNFEKLNQNIVKDKNALLERLMEKNEYKSVSLNKDNLIEMARLNVNEIGNVPFPSNKFNIKIWSNDHNPPHFHVIANGWDISFLIESGEEYRVNDIGKESQTYSYIIKNIKIWLSMQCKILPQVTNRENALATWIQLHEQ